MAAPKKFNAEYHIPWAWSLAIHGATDVEIANAFGVTERTINRWKYKCDKDGKPLIDENGDKVLSEFGKAIMTGKCPADAKVERSLYERCNGFEYTEEEKLVEVAPDGHLKPMKIKTTKKKEPPNVMAIMYWLNNRCKSTGHWAQKQTVTVTTDIDLQSQMKSIADLINAPDEPPRTIPEDD